MRLRRLELQGFKTFAARATLEFAPGITAVVGPNGSGKSNVADAVRWVLGEQSLRLLRGRKSEDVIFAGGAGRGPLGLAEVTLVLDNADGALGADFTEVAVGRRIYRSGESEYYVNRARVRLRDVVDLLARAGVGQNGHSVIGQGLVDLALSLRPEERRGLFEDAAGVRRYQVKRDEAETKLAEVRANAIRAADLVAELEPRLAQLQRQARRAQEEGHLRERWRGAVRAWIARQRWELQGTREGLDAEIDGLAREKGRAVVEAARAGVAEQEARAALATLEAELARWEGQQGAAREGYDAARRDLAVQRERQRAAEREASDLRSEVQRWTQRLVAAAADRQAAEDARGRAEAEVCAARRAAEDAQHALQAGPPAPAGGGDPDGLQGARREAADAARAVTQITTELREVERQQAGMDKQAAEAAEGGARAERSLQALATRLAALDTAVDETQRRVATGQRALEDIACRWAEAQRRLEGLTQEATRRDREGETLQLRLAVLDDLLGATPAIGDGGPGTVVQDTVAAHLRVPAELEGAVAGAAGPALQWILVDCFQTAATGALATAAAGGRRVTYAPWDRLVDHTGDHMGPGDPGAGGEEIGAPSLYAALAAATPPADEGHDRLRRGLLAGVYVVDDLPAALELAGRLEGLATAGPGPDGVWPGRRPYPVVVTRRGEVVSAPGVITAGAPPGEAALLERTRDRREVAHQLAQARSQRTALEAPLEAARREAQEYAAEERRLESAARALAQQASREEGERRALSQQRDGLEGDVRWWADFAARVAAQGAGLTDRALHLRQQVATVQQRQAAAAQRVQALTEGVQRRQAELAALREREAVTRTALGQAEARLVQAGQGVAAAAAAGQTAAEDLAAARARLQQREAEGSQARVAMQATEARVAALEAELASRAAEGHRLRAAASERLGDAESARRAAQRARDVLAAGQGRAAVLQERRAALDEREQALREQAARELGDLPQPEAGTEDADALRRDLEAAESRLRALGPVNQVALQEHAEAGERLEFLKGQLADLHRAGATLEAARAELDAGLQADFSRTFQAVAEYFRLYFNRLFGGGEAELRLTEPGNVSQTGVEIIARLPGKRRQELSLLSGGERALVAAALLFALLGARPSPFCILDEVDAALDETNVGRFCDVLEELSAQTQFVLITHNRASMERAGALYGVTLGEDGVSRVLSLRLSEAVQMVGNRAGSTNGAAHSLGRST